MKDNIIPIQDEIVLYQSEDGNVKVDVLFQDETVWLTQEQMAQLFGKGRTTITEHIGNIFKEGELKEEKVCRKFRHTTQHGAIEGLLQTQEVKYYNLDVIISVGYRVKSRQGVTRDCPLSHVPCYTAEIEASRKQYEYYREKLLTFKRKSA